MCDNAMHCIGFLMQWNVMCLLLCNVFDIDGMQRVCY